MKYRDVSTSPLWTNVSPGGAWVVLNFSDNALKKKTNRHLLGNIIVACFMNIVGL